MTVSCLIPITVRVRGSLALVIFDSKGRISGIYIRGEDISDLIYEREY